MCRNCYQAREINGNKILMGLLIILLAVAWTLTKITYAHKEIALKEQARDRN